MTGSHTILILYISVGQGHRRAALALEEALREEAPFLRIVSFDLLELWPSGAARLVAAFYRSLVRTAPGVWTYLYDRPEVKTRLDRPLRIAQRLLRGRLERMIKELAPAAVVCTQAFPCALAAECRSRTASGFVLAAVPTDFQVHAYWIYPEVDLYLLPTRWSVERLAVLGVPPERIRLTGIPVRPVFNRKLEPARMKEKYGLISGLPVVLLMGGGEGTLSLERLINTLDRSGEEFQLAALTGRNQRRYLRLQSLRGSLNHPLRVFGFTDLIEELMAAAEVIVTKPGGLTTAEALVRRLPLVLVDPLPGQEELNARFLAGAGAAIHAGDDLLAVKAVEDALREGYLRGRVLAAMEAIRKPHAARDAARQIISSFSKTSPAG